MFVSALPPTLLALLLLMATLQPYHLLPAEQSSLVPSLRHQMQAGSNLTINTTANHTLGFSLGPLSDECLYVVKHYNLPIIEGPRCRAYQAPWLDLLLEKGVHKADPEYKCKDDYLNIYCNVLLARAWCAPDFYHPFHEAMKRKLVDLAQKCNASISWQPPLESPLMITKETFDCENILDANGTEAKCTKEVDETATKWNIKDLTELACKKEYEMDKCKSRHACKNCAPKLAEEFLDYVDSIWSPKLVECTKWASEEPKMNCSVLMATTKSPSTWTSIPLTTTSAPPGSCLSVFDQKGIPERCGNESRIKYPDLNVEMQCRAAFYSYECGMKAACEHCSDTKDYVELARKDMDSNAIQCKPWLADEPKLKCSSSIWLIVGIVFAVIVVVLVVIGVVIYCMCFTSSDKPSGHRSSSKGSSRVQQSKQSRASGLK